jgi:hypothetical protein
MRKTPRMAVVEGAYFLQANDVCIELLDRMAEVMNFQTTRGP